MKQVNIAKTVPPSLKINLNASINTVVAVSEEMSDAEMSDAEMSAERNPTSGKKTRFLDKDNNVLQTFDSIKAAHNWGREQKIIPESTSYGTFRKQLKGKTSTFGFVLDS